MKYSVEVVERLVQMMDSKFQNAIQLYCTLYDTIALSYGRVAARLVSDLQDDEDNSV